MKRAIVIGGSMAGLITARVVSEFFEQVILIERDVLPGEAENRRGVPQGRHSHALLSSGAHVLEQLFPGFCDELTNDGALYGDPLLDLRWFIGRRVS